MVFESTLGESLIHLMTGKPVRKIMDNDHFIYEAGFFKGMRRNGEVLVMQMTSHGRMVDMGQ